MKVAEKLRETKPSKYLGIMNKMLNYIKTNIDPLEALNMAYTIYKFPSLVTEQLQIPVPELAEGRLYKDLGWVFYTIYKFPSLVTEQLQIPVPELAEGRLYKDLGWVFLMDGEQNAQILNDFIYKDKIPNVDEFDYYSLYQKLAQYAADEDIYNSENEINPEDYENSDKELPKQEEKPENPNPPVEPENPNPPAADEDIYNSENEINPEDYENSDKELPKQEEKPENPNPPVEPENPNPPIEPENPNPPVEPEKPNPPVEPDKPVTNPGQPESSSEQ